VHLSGMGAVDPMNGRGPTSPQSRSPAPTSPRSPIHGPTAASGRGPGAPAAASGPAARLVHVSKSFGDHAVLSDVSLSIPSGRCTFVVGPSGTGKSVTVRHIVGLLRPDEGEVYYGDERVDVLPEAQLIELRKRCVYVFQHPTLFDSMTVQENVSLVLRHHRGLRKLQGDRLALEQLEKLGLADLAPATPGHLAMGAQKMISLARALCLAPETLILDEPTTGLDPYAAWKLDSLVATLLTTGMTVIIISHDLRSIRRLASDVVFLLHRGVRFSGPASDFFSSPDPAVRQFVSGSVEGEI